MIATWMVGALMFSVLCALAAWAVEFALRTLRRPTRWPWVAGIVAAAVWPLLAPLVLAPSAEQAAVAISMMPAVEQVAEADVAQGALERMRALWQTGQAAAQSVNADRWLLIGWAALSLVLLTQLTIAARTLHRIRTRANRHVVDGEVVLVDPQMGPAAIGVVQPHIVVPSWLLDLDASMRALVLRHEREHCRAGDPRLVWLAAAVTSVLPWNVAVWFMARRLRLAMEIDCDARTLKGRVNPDLYARLLLLIAQRNGSARFAPMLSHHTSQLATRIAAMNAPLARFRSLRVALAAGVAAVAAMAACSSRIATNLTSPVPSTSTTPLEEVAVSTDSVSTLPYFDFQVDTPASLSPGSTFPKYPDALRAQNITGNVLAQFVVNTDGTPDLTTFKAVRSTDPAFTAAVREGLASMRFKPAVVKGKVVRQLMQVPFAFMLDGVTTVPLKSPTTQAAAEPSASAARRNAATVPTSAPSTGRDKALFDFQTERPATIRAGSKGPAYPAELRAARVEGLVLAQFIVNNDGTVDMGSFRALKSDHDEFTKAVREALSTMRFDPALVEGKAVRQLLQQPFQFRLEREE